MVVGEIWGPGGYWAYFTETNDLFSTKKEGKIGTRKADGKLYDLQGNLIGAIASFNPLQPSGQAMERLVRLASP
jgi:hypothetical protein